MSDAASLIERVIRQSVTLEKIASYSLDAVRGIAAADDAVARQAIDTVRLLRAGLGDADGDLLHRDAGDQDAARHAQRIRITLDAIRTAERVIAGWVERSRQWMLRDLSLADTQACQRVIDVVLPAAWDFSTDVIYLNAGWQPTLLDALRARGQRRIVLFMPDPAQRAQAGDPGPDCMLLGGSQDLYRLLDWFGNRPPRRLAELAFGRSDDALADDTDLRAQLKRTIRQVDTNKLTIRAFGRRWVEQGLANLPAIARQPTLASLTGLFQGRPAIIVSPGPSLERNIGLLRALNGRAVLIAPAQTLRRLARAGVRADFAMVIDPLDLTEAPHDFFADVPADTFGALIVAASCHPNVLARGGGRTVTFSTGELKDEWVAAAFGDLCVNISGGSVAVSAFRLALGWQCDPIILTGQDLAYTGGRHYAGDDADSVSDNRKLYELPGYYGGTVLSPPDYFQYHSQFEIFARLARETGHRARLYNCTEGGAFIAGFDHQPLADVIAAHLPERPLPAPSTGVATDASAIDPAVAAALTLPAAVVRQRNAAAIAALEAMLGVLGRCESLAVRMRAQLQGSGRRPSQLKRLWQDESQLLKSLGAMPVFELCHQAELSAARLQRDAGPGLDEHLALAGSIARVAIDGIAALRPMIQASLAALRS